MKQFLKTILLVSVLAIFIAGCAEESSNSAPTTSKTAEQVLADFMTEFNAMQAVDIGQLTPSSQYLSTTTASITNTRTDNKDAYFIGMDVKFAEFRGLKTDISLSVTPNPQDAPGVLISANGSSDVSFYTWNSPRGPSSSICVLLTQEEYAVIQELLQAETALTVEQMQTVIDLVKPYVVKINYSVQ